MRVAGARLTPEERHTLELLERELKAELVADEATCANCPQYLPREHRRIFRSDRGWLHRHKRRLFDCPGAVPLEDRL